MSERFIVDDAGSLIDMRTRDTFDYVSEVCPLLNELNEENKELKTDILLHIDDSEKYRKLSLQFDNRNKELISENALLEKENEQLKEQLSEQGIQIDFLEAENQHMRNLVNENKQLKKDKDDLIDFIKKEFPKSHKHVLEGFE